MTKKEAIELCAQMNIIRFAVLQTPDWNGGSYPEVYISTPDFNGIPDELQDYQYCNFYGDAQTVVNKRNSIIDGFRNSNLATENPGEDYTVTVADMLIEAANKYLY